MNKNVERIYNGIIKENPTFILMLGMCPTLAVTTSAVNGVGMGLSTTVVLILSNMLISMLRKIIPDKVRVPAFIVIVASFVTIVQFLVQGFIPSLYDALGIYIPLIVVNCIILGRAESYASKNPVVPSIFDGVGMGLGFTLGLTCIGIVREIIGAGAIFNVKINELRSVMGVAPGVAVGIVILVVGAILIAGGVLSIRKNGSSPMTILAVAVGAVVILAAVVALLGQLYTPITVFGLAPGAFFVLAALVAIMNVVRASAQRRGKPLPKAQGCLAGDCASCGMSGACTGKSASGAVNQTASAKAEKTEE